ncbi:hypothetical protein [Streptosporangium saharense]|uniref:hypothetical protein n=1 Tax=Streptosporangium saharense TaxID=1706840 RepID=UPI0033184ACD
MNTSLRRVAQRFPLIARPRPVCLPLRSRVAELVDLAYTAADGTKTNRLTVAAETLNKAALIASDCGIPEMARSLCWRHFTAHLSAWPLDASRARVALEPLVNLARLTVREREGVRGYLLLKALFHAVSSGSTADLDGHRVSFGELTRTDDDLRTVRTWLWGVFLAEGVRALISAGRWDQAVAHAQRHRGVGRRLLDGRQAVIVAHCLAGDLDTALRLLTDSVPEQPWEHAVADCLEMLYGHAAGRSPENKLAAYGELGRSPALLVFRTRLGLTVLDVAPSSGDQVFASLLGDILTTADGYTAREVLVHERGSTLLSLAERRRLTSIVRNAGLGSGAIPTPLMSAFLSAIQMSEAAMKAALTAS